MANPDGLVQTPQRPRLRVGVSLTGSPAAVYRRNCNDVIYLVQEEVER
jgi:hypothetical protein